MLDTIETVRLLLGLPCQKVSFVNASSAAPVAFAALLEESVNLSIDLLGNNVQLAPCMVPRPLVPEAFVGISIPDDQIGVAIKNSQSADEEEEDSSDSADPWDYFHWRRLAADHYSKGGRQLGGSSYYFNYSKNDDWNFDWDVPEVDFDHIDIWKEPEPCDRQPYWDRVAELKEVLTYSEYHEFLNIYRQWLRENKNVCDDRVFDAINDALCQVQIENEACQPSSYRQLSELGALLTSLGIYSLYGPNWASQVEAVCAELGEDNSTCQVFRATNVSQPYGSTEVGL